MWLEFPLSSVLKLFQLRRKFVMKSVFWLLAGALALASVAPASPCTGGSLASYEALGAGGCTIGNTLFSAFATLSGLSGGTAIPASAVSITPSGSTFSPQLQFQVNQTANAPDLFEAIFNYQVSGPVIFSSIALSGSSETGYGAVTDIQNLCSDGHFGPDGVSACSGTANSLLTLDGVQNSDSTALTTVSFLSVTDDLTIDSGGADSASAGTFTDQFAVAPEPAPALLLAASFVTFGLLRRRLTFAQRRITR
jgi:hypothetical protein